MTLQGEASICRHTWRRESCRTLCSCLGPKCGPPPLTSHPDLPPPAPHPRPPTPNLPPSPPPTPNLPPHNSHPDLLFWPALRRLEMCSGHGNPETAGHPKPSYLRIQEIASPGATYVHDHCKAAMKGPVTPEAAQVESVWPLSSWQDPSPRKVPRVPS